MTARCCGNCRHWFGLSGWAYGRCERIRTPDGAGPGQTPAAALRADLGAELITRPDFGCTLFETRKPAASPRSR
jgi:hypothetical protein